MSPPAMYISNSELQQMERLLGKLLLTANPKEQVALLGLHKRLKSIYAAQASDRKTIEYLKRLVS